MRYFSLLVQVLILLVLMVSNVGAAEMTRAQLDALVEQALQNNPDLQAAKARWEMSGHKVVPARTLDDPLLGIGFSNYPVDSFRSDETPMTGDEVKLSQNFPYPGKLAAKGDMAAQQARWYQAAYLDARLKLTGEVKDAYYRLYYQDRAIAVTEEELEILKNFIALTKTRYEVGKGLQQDLLKAQVEQSKLLDKLLTLHQQRTSVLAGLNQLLARPSGAQLEPVDKPELTPPGATVSQLQQLARESRPMFAAYEAQIDRFESQRRLAKLDSYPNFNLWTSYRFRDDDLPDGGTDFVSAGVGLSLPIWREKRSEEVAEADSGIRMARRLLEEFGNRVDMTIADLYAQAEKNRDLAQLFATGIIPQAQQTFDASLAAYQVGKVEFLSLLDSLLTLYRYRLDYQRVLTDYQRNLARLEAVVGSSPTAALQTSELSNPNGF